MKIAFVTAFYTPAIGGVKQVVEELAERYVKQGHKVHVYCSDSDKYKRIPVKEEIINGVHVHRCYNWFTIANFATFWPSILWKLWKEDFDLIHSHVSGHSYVFFAALVSKLKGITHVHTTHCPWTEGYRSLLGRIMVKLTYPTFLKLSFKWIDKIIAITPWELKFIEKWGVTRDKIKVIPNGMDKLLLKPIKNNDFRKKLKIRKKDKIVLFFGRLNPTKAPDKLV
ncbi:MAG: glycosyltransferase family 4 protein, partial [Nanoarchaeota archaeon]|nr:glycosyltransferase family 4 protein [Nanoarchaeota archaeon]